MVVRRLAVFKVSPDEDANNLCEIEFMKDGEGSERIVSALESVEVGKDEDGDRNCPIAWGS